MVRSQAEEETPASEPRARAAHTVCPRAGLPGPPHLGAGRAPWPSAARGTLCAPMRGSAARFPAGGSPGRHRSPQSPRAKVRLTHCGADPPEHPISRLLGWQVLALPAPLWAQGSCHGLLPGDHPRPRVTPTLLLAWELRAAGGWVSSPSSPRQDFIPAERPGYSPFPPQPHSTKLKACLLQKASLDCSSQSGLEGGQLRSRLPHHTSI